MVSWLVGDRGVRAVTEFMNDVAERLANRVQLTTDGHKAYLNAADSAFNEHLDYAMLVKLYGSPKGSDQERRRAGDAGCDYAQCRRAVRAAEAASSGRWILMLFIYNQYIVQVN